MTDLALIIQDGRAADIAFDDDFVTDDGLRTAIIFSVWTDARATEDDLKRFGREGEDKRGVWWDSIAPVAAGDRTGSLLWLLERAKQTEETRRISQDMIRVALNWLIEDGLAKSVDVTARWGQPGLLGWRASLVKVDGTRFDVEWQASLQEVS